MPAVSETIDDLLTSANAAAARTAIGALGGTLPEVGIDQIPWVAAFEASRLPVVADGTELSTWTDFSAGGNDATQTGSTRPAYKVAANGINGLPVVRFAGSEYMQTAAGAATCSGDFYMAAVVKFSDLTGHQMVGGFGDEATGERRLMQKVLTSNKAAFNGYSADVEGVALSVNTPYLIEITRSGTTVSVYVNGVRGGVGSPSLNAFASAVITLGGNNAGTETFIGDLGLFAILDRMPTAAELAFVRWHAKDGYGITVYNASGEPLLKMSADGELVDSGIFANSDSVGSLAYKLDFKSAGTDQEHRLKATWSGSGFGGNVLFLQQLHANGFSGVYGKGHDVIDGIEGYGAAFCWGNTGAPAPFGTSGYMEVYNALSSSFYPLRLIQTNNAGFYTRLEIDAANGDFIFYRRDAAPTPTEAFRIKASGDITIPKTITAAATTGAQTINKLMGSVNFAAAATSLVVTNSYVTANSVIICTVATNDATMVSVQAVAGSGSFSLHANAAATAETRVNFLVFN